MKILIVDDSKTMRLIVMRTLQQAGYANQTFIEAANGQEALSAVKTSAPDLVLLDWNMPGMSGLEVLQQLKAEGSAVKVGFVTSEGTPEMREKAKAAGALFLITKPFTVESFRKVFDRFIMLE
jgi:two-component system chemotaxis response regulator CheY